MGKEEISKYLAKLGSKGGKESAKRLTKAERIARARKAGLAARKKEKREDADKTRNREQKGSIERFSDFWYLRYADWRIENGVRVRKQNLTHKLAPVLKEHQRLKRPPKYVEELQREFMKGVNSSRSAPQMCNTITQFVDAAWLPDIENRLASSTVTVYKYYWEHILKPHVGGYLLRDFTTAQAEASSRNWPFQPHDAESNAPQTALNVSGIFKRGIGLGYRIGTNPCREITAERSTLRGDLRL